MRSLTACAGGQHSTLVASTLKGQRGKGGGGIGPEETLVATGFNANFSNQGGMGEDDQIAPLTGQAHSAAVHVAAPLSHGSNPNSNMAGRRREDDENLVYGLNTNRGGDADVCMEEDRSPPVTGSHGNPGGVLAKSGVRRLTPTECERLQAFPDGWTDPTGEEPDSRRYAALGDAVTVNVAHWIGLRIMAAERAES